MTYLSMQKKKTIGIGVIQSVCWIWIALPVAIFLSCWIKPLIGIPLTIMLAFSVYKAIRKIPYNSNGIVVNGKFFGILSIVLSAVLISGIGGFSPQMEWDHGFRNAVFYDLVKYSWPVVDTSQNIPRLLCYYLCFWLPSAAVAKLTGSLLVGNICLVLYAFIGMSAVFLLLSHKIGKVSVWIAIFFFCFCSWDLFAYILTYPWKGAWEMFIAQKDPSTPFFGAPSPIHLLFFAYNHGIPAWVGFTLMYINRKSPGILILILGMLAGFAPIPCVGVAPVVTYHILRNFRQSMTLSNISGLLTGIVFTLYMVSNQYGGDPGLAFDSTNALEFFYCMAAFFCCTYLPFFPFIWKEIKHDTLFWGLLVTSLILPMIRIGILYDFGWRVGVPFTCYFIYFVMKRAAHPAIHQKLFKAVAAIGIISASWIGYHWLFHAYLAAKKAPSYYVDPKYQSTYRADWLGSCFNHTICYNNFVADNPDTFFTRHMLRTDHFRKTDGSKER